MFKRDAELFRQWQLLKGIEARCKATAALCSLLFAGMAKGLPSGKHEEKIRDEQQAAAAAAAAEARGGSGGGKASAPKPFSKCERYTYIPHDNESDSVPMFQIALEEIYNANKTEVIAIGVWLFVNDEYHSTSHMMDRVMQENRAMQNASRAAAETLHNRCKNASAETARHEKAGLGFSDLDKDFEKAVGLQFKRCCTMDDLLACYNLHSGKTSKNPGCPRVPDLPAHMNCAAGRRAPTYEPEARARRSVARNTRL